MSIDPTSDPRMAGDVRRYHTWPVLQEQTIAHHSWNVARILLAIWPEVPQHVVIAALFHDIGEGKAGDLPFPTKSNNRLLREEMEKAEHNAHLAMCLPWRVPGPSPLTLAEQQALKLADMLEMWEKGLQEQLLGNNFAELVAERMHAAIEQATMLLPVASEYGTSQIAVRNYLNRRVKTWCSPRRPDMTGQTNPFGFDPVEDVA